MTDTPEPERAPEGPELTDEELDDILQSQADPDTADPDDPNVS